METKTILVKGGHLLDPYSGLDGQYDILIAGGKVKKVAPHIKEEAEEQIDASGLSVLPGFIDLHVHFREPGFTYKETIKTGSLAAAAGGFTSVCPMPNTKPVIDSPEMVKELLSIAQKDSVVHILPVGAVTKGQEGKEVADILSMKEAGAAAISEDGKSVMDEKTYEQGMKLAKKAGIPVFAHCEDKDLVGDGAVNEGIISRKLQVPGISNEVENRIVRRDIALAEKTGARLHLCHCSTKESVEYLREAQAKGMDVTGEACPHHFTLADADIPGDDASYKMNPPLRAVEDVEAIKQGLKTGILGVIATDHAPHGEEEKMQPVAKAPFGIVGLETAFPLAVSELVEGGYLTPYELVKRFCCEPARVLGIKAGSLSEGMPADLVLADFNASYTIDKNTFFSKGKNTPFDGRKVKGKILLTMVGGMVVYKAEK